MIAMFVSFVIGVIVALVFSRVGWGYAVIGEPLDELLRRFR